MKKIIGTGLMVLVMTIILALTCASAAVDNISALPGLSALQTLPTLPAISTVQRSADKIEDKHSAVTDADSLVARIGTLEDTVTAPTFKLPASLQVIEDEAFEGTAIVAVELPDNVVSIGERAFADIKTLRVVKISERTDRIASSAFAGSNKVTITAAAGSFARAFARENGLPFIPVIVQTATNSTQVIVGLGNHNSELVNTDSNCEDGEQLPSWRPADEIQSEHYNRYITSSITTRAPPINA